MSLLGGRRCCRLEGVNRAASVANGPRLPRGYVVHLSLTTLAGTTTSTSPCTLLKESRHAAPGSHQFSH
jgi:hypothetical protein